MGFRYNDKTTQPQYPTPKMYNPPFRGHKTIYIMAVFYNKMQRKNPSKPAEPAKWYPVLRRVEMMKEKDVARHISDETTLNPKEAEMAVSQLKKVLINALLNGQSVQLGDWGTFHLTFSSEGVTNVIATRSMLR